VPEMQNMSAILRVELADLHFFTKTRDWFDSWWSKWNFCFWCR